MVTFDLANTSAFGVSGPQPDKHLFGFYTINDIPLDTLRYSFDLTVLRS